MISLHFLILAFSTFTSVLAHPADLVERQRPGGGAGGGGGGSAGGATTNYQQNWSDNGGISKFSNGPGGQYTVKWSGKGNFVCGKGYQPGGPRNISYSGVFTPTGNAYLSIYGWTTNPLVEFYIIESYGTHKPCSDSADAEHKGNMTSDGGEYEIWTKMRRNKPSIQGTATFPQFWSIRTVKRVGGVVNTANHFKAWEAAGLKLGKHNYEIVATEGQDSEGIATITVGVAPTEAPTAAPEAPPASAASSQSTTAPAAKPTGKSSKNKHAVPSIDLAG